ncbi:MAG: hypothetical protein ABIK62_05685, partial [candidate division WOR-3 bacterium]
LDAFTPLVIDGQGLRVHLDKSGQVTVHRRNDRWLQGAARRRSPSKTFERYGPAKQAMMKPFLLVYGTHDPKLAAVLQHAARQEAVRWWLNGNGYAEVYADTELTEMQARSKNLVLYGGARENSVTARLANSLPIRIQGQKLVCGAKSLGDSLAAVFVYPNPLNQAHLVLVRMGTDAEHTKLALMYGIAGPGTGVPDFMVFDSSVRRYGWAGVRAAGFFDSEWRLDPRSSWIRD